MRHSKIQSVKHENELYDRGRTLSQRLKVPFPELLLHVDKIDRYGNRERVIDYHSRSIVRNWYNRFYHIFTGWNDASGVYGDGTLRCKRIDGVSLTINPSIITGGNVEGAGAGFRGNANDDSKSILIGTGNAVEAVDDYALAVLIDHGTAAGEMQYGATTFNEGWNAGGPYYWSEYERVFDNGSGGPITVEESGIAWNNAVLAARDYFGGGIAVADSEGIAINYEFRMTFP